MEREYGPEGQIIIRGFPKSEGAGDHSTPQFANIKHSSGFRRHAPAYAGLFLVLALVVAGIAMSSSDGSAGLTDEERALIERVTSSNQEGADSRGSSPSAAGSRGASAADRLSIDVLSNPDGASVFIDFDSVGITPLHDYAIAQGVYVVSVASDEGARVDTVLILEETSDRVFDFSLISSSDEGASYADRNEPPLVIFRSGNSARSDEPILTTQRHRTDARLERPEPVASEPHRASTADRPSTAAASDEGADRRTIRGWGVAKDDREARTGAAPSSKRIGW